MANLMWQGQAPNIPQIDYLEFPVGQVIAEGADLEFKINNKTIKVEAPLSRIEDNGTAEGDTGGILALLQAAEAAINGSTIPEFQEVEALVQVFDDSDTMPYSRLRIQSRENFFGIPFNMTVTGSNPKVDVDVVDEGGAGSNAKFTIVLTGTGETGYIRVTWDPLGTGEEISTDIDYEYLTAESLKAGIVLGMPSVIGDDINVSGSGTSADPFVIECVGDLALLTIPKPTVSTSGIAGGGSAHVTTIVDGSSSGYATTWKITGSGPSEDIFNVTVSITVGGNTYTVNNPGSDPAGLQSQLESVLGVGNVTVTGGLGYETGGATAHFVYFVTFTGIYSGTTTFIGISGPYGTTTESVQVYSGTQNEKFHAVFDLLNTSPGQTFTITYDGQTTSAITINSSPATTATNILDALVALSNIASGDVGVSSVYSQGATFQTFVIEFIGPLANTNVVDLTAAVPGSPANASFRKIIDGGVTGVSEVQSFYTNGTGGKMEVTFSSISVTVPWGISPSSLLVMLNNAWSNVLTSVTGQGISTNPYILTFTGTTNRAQITVDPSNLGTNQVRATVTPDKSGAPPTQFSMEYYFSGVTGGTYYLTYNGRKTANLAYNANAAAVLAALQALEPGDFTSAWAVTGSGTYASPFVVTLLLNIYGPDDVTMEVSNNNLTGVALSLDYYTEQEADGKWFVDNGTNYYNIDTGGVGAIPVDGDALYVQVGGTDNSMRYGSLVGVQLAKLVISQQFTGDIGLPRLNAGGYYEYRQTVMDFEFQNGSQSFNNPNIIIGVEQGQGSGLIRIRTRSSDQVNVRIENTGGPAEDGMPSVNLEQYTAGTGTDGTTNSTLEHITGFVGTAMRAASEMELYRITQRGGVMYFGAGTNVSDGGWDRVNGETYGRFTLNGVPMVLGG